MVPENAARAARLADYGIAPGNKADLVVLGAPSVRQALRLQPPRRHVIKNGTARAMRRATPALLFFSFPFRPDSVMACAERTRNPAAEKSSAHRCCAIL